MIRADAEHTSNSCDLLVIGGGINGAGIANDAAGRGLRVVLCEQHDLAAHTSSASSKLIHGGLRYLEHYEFRLVREALAEREVLLAKAPHLVRPLPFVLPYRAHLRPRWLLRAGLFLYDHLGRRQQLPASKALQLPPDGPLQPDIQHAFEYHDCQVDDARLVLVNALQARQQGASILTRTRCVQARRVAGGWHVELENAAGQRLFYQTSALVNAAGPWASRLFAEVLHEPAPHRLRLVRGSHILVPPLVNGHHGYILQHTDGRVVFVLPWDGHSLIGTTDVDHTDDPGSVVATEEEQRYLLDVVNAWFKRQLQPADILHSFAGVRPLLDDHAGSASRTTRDYHLDLQGQPGQPPLLSVFGGKLTTYRRLAESAMQRLRPWFPAMGADWTANSVLPGGDILDPEAFAGELRQTYTWLPAPLCLRLASTYGSLCHTFLHEHKSLQSLGRDFGEGLNEAELHYLHDREWAVNAEDVLWRRTRLGLGFSVAGKQALGDWLAQR